MGGVEEEAADEEPQQPVLGEGGEGAGGVRVESPDAMESEGAVRVPGEEAVVSRAKRPSRTTRCRWRWGLRRALSGGPSLNALRVLAPLGEPPREVRKNNLVD